MTKLVDLLKKQLKDSEGQIKHMQEMMNKGNYMPHSTKEMQEKNVRLVSLKNKHDELEEKINNLNITLERTNQRLEEMTMKFKDERDKKSELEKENRALGKDLKNLHYLEKELEDTKREKLDMELKIKELCASPFFVEHEDKANIYVQIKTLRIDLDKLTQERDHLKEINMKYEAQNRIFHEDLNKTQRENKMYIEENARLKALSETHEKSLGVFREFEEDPDGFYKTLGMLKWKGTEPGWAKLNFLERGNMFDDSNPKVMQKEIEKLKMEKGELAAQLEKAQTLLKTYMEMEEQNRRIREAEAKKTELQLKAAINRAEELSKIVDLKGQANKDGLRTYEINGVKYDDSVSEFSVDTDDTSGHNVFDLWIGQVDFDMGAVNRILENKDPNRLNRDVKKMLTFVTVDFYNYDTQNSTIVEGLRSNYNFQVAYRVVADELFIRFKKYNYFFFKFNIIFNFLYIKKIFFLFSSFK